MLALENIVCRSGDKIRLEVGQLTIHAGQLTAIVGPNGAGKTTLFRAIGGELPVSGCITLNGIKLSCWAPLMRARHLAVLPQSSQLSFSFRAFEVVSLGLIPLTVARSNSDALVNHYMQLTDCQHFANQAYPTLSGGERQRVQLARVLLQLSQAENPPLLLLDEPTSAQDMGHQHSILRLVKSLCERQEFAILTIMHDLNQVMHYCDNCALFNNGKLIQYAAPSQVLYEDSIEKYWHYRPTRITRHEQPTVFI